MAHPLPTILLLLLISPALSAAGNRSSPAWDCWVDPTGPGAKIRCIEDRDPGVRRPGVDEAALDDDDATAEALLNWIHDLLHAGTAADLNQAVRDSASDLRDGDLWSIRIHNPPGEDSWRKQKPQTLVRSLLCSEESDCQVRFRPPNMKHPLPMRDNRR
jgi:hypothetical protein